MTFFLLGILDTSSSSVRSNASSKKKNAPVVTISDHTDPKITPNNPFYENTDNTDNNEFQTKNLNTNTTTKKNNPFLEVDDDENSTKSVTSVGRSQKQQAPSVPSIAKSARNMNNFQMAANDDDENIEWDSSEDEEIVKKEVATFERNQVNTFFTNKIVTEKNYFENLSLRKL